MIEMQLAQIVVSLPAEYARKIPGQLENSRENVNAVTTRGGKSTRDPPKPNHSAGKTKERQEAEPSSSTKTQKEQEEEETAPQDFTDPSYLPFPTRNRKQAMDEQFPHFVEMIEKIHVSVPLMDV